MLLVHGGDIPKRFRLFGRRASQDSKTRVAVRREAGLVVALTTASQPTEIGWRETWGKLYHVRARVGFRSHRVNELRI